MAAAKNIGRNRNVNDTAVVPAAVSVPLGSTVVIATANPDRVFFRVDNNSANKGVYVKLQPATTDNDLKGIFIKGQQQEPFWEMPPDNIYTGEISAQADTVAVDVFVTEY